MYSFLQISGKVQLFMLCEQMLLTSIGYAFNHSLSTIYDLVIVFKNQGDITCISFEDEAEIPICITSSTIEAE
jgi:hypothetical protein